MLFGVLVDVDMRVRSSAILLIALVGGVLLDVALLPLLVRILRTLLAARGSRGHLLAVAGSLRALVLGGNRWHLAGHDAVSCCWPATSTGGTHRGFRCPKNNERNDMPFLPTNAEKIFASV